MIAHLLEHIIRRKFIFCQRVSLCISMQPNPLTHLIHIINMIHPFLVNHAQHHHALQLTHAFFALSLSLTDFLFLHFIQLIAQLCQGFLQLILCHLRQRFILDIHLADRNNCTQRFAECRHIPFLRQLVIAHMCVHRAFHNRANHADNAVSQVFTVKHAFSFAINDFSLLIHDLVIFQQMLTNGKVIALHLFLCVFNRFGKHPCFNRLVLCHAHRIYQLHCLFGAKQTHQVILQRDIETGFAGVTLTTGTPTQLVINTSGFMTFRTDDFQTTQLCNAFAQLNVRTTAGHVCRNRNCAHLPCQCNDFRFLCMIFCIQHLMLHALHLQQLAQCFGFFDCNRTNQYRLSLFVCRNNISYHRAEFARLGTIHNIIQILSLYRAVCGNFHNVHPIDITEFFFLCFRRTCHTAFLSIFIEIVLEGNRCQSFALSAHLYVFLRLDCLMQTVGIASARHHTPRKFINDNDFALMNHIILIQMHVIVCLQGIVDIMLQLQIFGIGKVVHGEIFFRLCNTFLRQHNRFRLFIQNEVAFLLNFLLQKGIHCLILIQNTTLFQFFNKQICHAIQIRGLGATAGNNQGCSGFVNQNRVNLIDDGIMQVSLHHVFLSYYHVVTQVVKAEFIVCTIGNIAGIRRAAFVVVHPVQDAAHAQP